MLCSEIELLMKECRHLFNTIDTAARLASNLASRTLSKEACEPTKKLCRSLNQLTEVGLREASEEVKA